MANISPARRAAFQILMAVERGSAHADDLLRAPTVSSLSDADRNLTTALVMGVLRWQLRLDHQVKGLLRKPGAKLDTEVLIALRIGTFQLQHMDRIPAHAAIDESVELARQAGHHYASRMVNSVLRKLAAAGSTEFPKETAGELAMEWAHPAWMVERWAKFYGIEAARMICRYGQSQPAQSVRVKEAAVEEEFAQAGIVLDPGELLAAARIVVSGDIAATAAFLEGRVRLQDEGSQLVAELAGGYPKQKVEKILDACAAPGGKTLILAERNPGARIVACERSPQRLAALRNRLAAFGARIECRLADASALEEESEFDLVLADVPCSGTGTLGRNPEIRHRLALEDFPRQAERQEGIFEAALRAVRPGGCVVYSTCSLEPEENEDVVASVLKRTPNSKVIPVLNRLVQLRSAGVLTESGAERLRQCLTPEGYLRLMPGAFRGDGFFIAMVERTS
ncbi:MAG TPA: transcription antitermination factor NusB [Terracidiphilus sp.]|nr:transcription antitermination factor NusB [Terracidiphilus sp.]